MLSDSEENVDNEKLFAIQLADNDKRVRDKCLSKVRNYIQSRANTNDGNEINLNFA
jgi:hypothetical protein